ncbi:hypothetical protein BK141_10740 [Paenibacillus sp. FSL R5-0765]|nr:hypothetical protein BK141_10740 [Paenibacillus sp. FSL R5-0765]
MSFNKVAIIATLFLYTINIRKNTFSPLLLYGMPIILIIVGYFIFKGYKKRRGVKTNESVAPDGQQANIKP